MKTEEKKDPETRNELAREDIEIDLEKDGEKIAGGDDTRARANVCNDYHDELCEIYRRRYARVRTATQLFERPSISIPSCDDTRARANCYDYPLQPKRHTV